MDYEKAYKEALERAKAGKPLDEVFSELNESDDERIRKSLVEYFRKFTPEKMWDEMFSFGDVVSYLEKQKEQKPAEKISVSEELYEHIRNTCACIDDAMSSDTLCDMTDYLEMADSSAQKAFDMVEKSVIKQPAEWTEEDKMKIVELKTFIAQCNGFDKENRKKAFDMIDSLRPQPHWKPSEEQMDALETAVSSLQSSALESLYNKLKKL